MLGMYTTRVGRGGMLGMYTSLYATLPYHPVYTTLYTPWVHPCTCWSTLLHWSRTVLTRVSVLEPWAQKKRFPWAGASFLAKSVKSVKEEGPLCAELLRFSGRLSDKDWIDTG